MRRGGSTERGAGAGVRPPRTRRLPATPEACCFALVALAGLAGLSHAEVEFRGLRVEASYASDDNVNRAPADEALADGVVGVRVGTSLVVPVTRRTRAIFQGFGGGEKFRKYDGLSHNFLGAQGELQFRPSAEFGAPTYAVFLRTALEQYDSTLRDGYRHSFGASVFKPLTDRLQLYGALVRNVSDGKSAVFDASSTSLRGNLDWVLGRWDTAYLGAEYRSGDSVSTISRSDPIRTLGFVNTASPYIVQDDAFDDVVRDAYRLKTRTLVATLGYNHAFGGGQSLDVSLRRVQSRVQNAAAPLSGSDLDYAVSQFSLAYLVRF